MASETFSGILNSFCRKRSRGKRRGLARFRAGTAVAFVILGLRAPESLAQG